MKKTGKKCKFCADGFCKKTQKSRGPGFGTVSGEVWVCESCGKDQSKKYD